MLKPWNRYRTNSLLMRDDIGQAKQTTYHLPSNEFYFGKPVVQDKEGAQAVTMTWQNHEVSRDAVPDRDFRKLNKMCVTSQLHKADQYYQFRKSTDARVSVKKGSTNISMHLPEENFRYGKPYAPQSPMKMILANDYANQAEEIMNRKYDLVARQQDAAEKASRPKTTTKHTKASRLCTSAIKERLSSTDQKTLFKLSQFDNVAAKTQTRNFKTQPKT